VPERYELNRWQYDDNRTEDDKKSRVWKVEEIDDKTGEIRSKRNILLNKDGNFKSTEKLNNNWISRIFNRNKPNH
jgi:beta-lactamase class D